MKPARLLMSAAFALTAVLMAAMMMSCSKAENEPEPVVTVQVAKVERGEIKQTVRNEGILYARDQAAITPKVVSPVKMFYVNRGSRVNKGQLLAVLENRDLAATEMENKGSYEQAQATYGLETSSALPEEWQKAEFDRKTAKEAYDAEQKVYDSRRVLYQEGAMPRKDLDQSAVALIQARAQFDIAQKHLTALESAGKKDQLKSAKGQLISAQGKYEGAAAQLAYSEIRSPIDGVVTDRPLYAGETAPAGTPLMVIMDTSTVIARVHIPQAEAALLKVGDPAALTAPSEVQAVGTVTLVSPALDPNSTTVEVWIEAPNPDGRMRPGTSVKIEIVARTVPDALVMPASALLKTPEGASAVMIVKDDRARRVAVETGIRDGDKLQITSGIAEGDTVIVSGAYGLPDNTRVKIATPPATADQPESGGKAGSGKD